MIDGDTIEVVIGGQTETVRLLGIDTPETVHPTRPIECFGPEASAATSELLPEGTPVRLERDVELRDHFGRLLAFVYRSDDNAMVNLALISAGMAEANQVGVNRAFQDRFTRAERIARVNRIGMWETCR